LLRRAVAAVERPSEDIAVVRLSRAAQVVSTVPPVLNPEGLVESIVFARVPEDFNPKNVLEYYRGVLGSTGIDSGVVLLSAVPPRELIEVELPGVGAEVFLTVSAEPPTCLGSPHVYEPMRAGTVNIAVVVEEPLARSAMVDLLRTVAEAKVAAFSDSLIRCESRALGTVSDAIAVVKPADLPEEILFSGPATRLGRAVAEAVYRVVVSKAFSVDRGELLRRVTGLGAGDVLEIFSQVYSRASIPGLGVEEAREVARRYLDRILEDPNVWSFLIAARELDLHGLSGTIPGIGAGEFRGDPVRLVADEVLGMALSLYLAGLKGLFSMYWVERLKERGDLGHGSLHPFEDDVVSALVGSLLTKLLEEGR
jgi:alpha-ribazole phosphatase CobZ